VSRKRIFRGAAAGAVAATAWAAQEPLDMKVFGVGYSDAELLAKPLRAPRWVGGILHVVNGAVFGAVYAGVASHVSGPGVAKGTAAGMCEHLATWPLVRFLPRVNLWGNHAAFAQAVWRHVLFGALLGGLEERLNAGYADGAPA
jgi:hypothetical protein